MRKVTLSDYRKIIEQYREIALKNGAIDVVQCGSVDNPGVSDIDCIVVVREWVEANRGLIFYNPEILSVLFTHGPFICTKDLLGDLFKYTTLRALGSSRSEYLTFFDEEKSKIIIAARQVRSWLHFDRILNSNFSDRSILLILKSVLYSLDECKIYFNYNSNYIATITSIKNKLNIIRSSATEDGIIDNFELHNLIIECKLMLSLAGEQMALWVAFATKIKNSNKHYVMNEFLNILAGNSKFDSISPEIENEIIMMRNFRAKIMGGYSASGAIWKGAEFPFHIDCSNLLGYRIWFRRYIKKIVVPMIRLMRKVHA
ncbi:hypothetical protein [Desulfurivibrio sp. C05AmB]|uniref:hypothetical protein n=1 Tax=Desulfurivibrio sp. C05AmB TaxID=3374371 RepID=UPI00376EC146